MSHHNVDSVNEAIISESISTKVSIVECFYLIFSVSFFSASHIFLALICSGHLLGKNVLPHSIIKLTGDYLKLNKHSKTIFVNVLCVKLLTSAKSNTLKIYRAKTFIHRFRFVSGKYHNFPSIFLRRNKQQHVVIRQDGLVKLL